MASSCYLSPAVRATTRAVLDALGKEERKGRWVDFTRYEQPQWLPDSAVIARVVRIRGEWRVNLVFAHVRNPLQLLQRLITAHPTRSQAALQAHYMSRLAAKDARGTQCVQIGQLSTCLN